MAARYSKCIFENINRILITKGSSICKFSANSVYFTRQVKRFAFQKTFLPFGQRDIVSLLGTQSYVKTLSSRSITNEIQGFENILGLIRSELDTKFGDCDTVVMQMNVMKALVEHKKGNIISSEVSDTTELLTPKDLYELGAVVFNLSGTVGNEAVELAAPIFKLACIRGNTDAKYSYAQLLQAGHGTEADPIEAAKMFRELAQQGHPYAQYTLGQMYYLGHGIEQDFKAAFSLFKVSATNGLSQAFSSLGLMYKQGQGIKQDLQKAVEYFRKGAEKGDVPAIMHLAHCYSHGSGTESDYTRAFELHLAAAEAGHSPAVHNVGVHYFGGRGVELDMNKAAQYFAEAAKSGFELSLINLGNMYYNGLGVERNLEKAKELYSQAAPSNKQAQLLLEELQDELAGKQT